MEDSFPKNIRRVLGFLQRSIAKNKGKGSSGYYHLLLGWSNPYPETTGYIIETLWDYHKVFPELELDQLAKSCSDWLCDIHLERGAFPGGLYAENPQEPIVFDTGQVLFGLVRSFCETQDIRYKTAAEKARRWLVQLWDTEGSWESYSYMPGYEPSYNTRVLWAVLKAQKKLGLNQELDGLGIFDHYAVRIREDGWVSDWGFRPGEAAFTHTIAYTWRGFLESALLLNDASRLQMVLDGIDRLLKNGAVNGKWAGRYNEGWHGGFGFVCVVGHAQLSLLFNRVYELTKKEPYRIVAKNSFERIRKTPASYWPKGGVPGSLPIWGSYQRFRYPNWAAKFYLDGALLSYDGLKL